MSEFVIEQVPSPEESFVIVSNDFARGRLPVPLRALERVLLLHLLSLSTGWRGGRRQLDAGVMEGREAVSSALRGLEQKGYLRRDKKRDARGTWHWTWRVTRDPIGAPLPAPSPENPSLDATCGNTTSPQVDPSTGNPATDNRGISTEDQPKKTTKKTDGTSSGAAPPVKVHAGARTGLRGEQLVGMEPKELTRKLVAVWSAVVKEEGAQLPYLESGYWMGHGDFEGREPHPIGGTLKAWLETNPSPTVEHLEDALTKVRQHAMDWARKGVAA